MIKAFFIVISTLLVLILSCKKEVMWDSAYVVGFDPCTGAYPDSLNKGYILITIDSKDTVATYNLQNDIFDFPESYFANYKSNCLFPDSMRYNFRVRIKYSFTEEKNKVASFCFADIYQGIFYQYTNNRQITLHSARKE